MPKMQEGEKMKMKKNNNTAGMKEDTYR